MIVYRIVKEEYSKVLKASGYAARWNHKGSFVIYAAESKSLACLENLVHRSGEGNNGLYKVMLIQVPDSLKIEIIDALSLKAGWQKIEHFTYCQNIGADWLSGSEKAILELKRVVKVGGVIIFSVPVDFVNTIYFNAHRAFTRDYILSLFDGFELLEEKYQYGYELVENFVADRGFGTGLFMFTKVKQ